MNNCLVTKFKGEVSDTSLLKLNELRIRYTGSGVKVTVIASSAITITATGDMTIDGTNEGRSYNLEANKTKDIYCPQNTMLSIPNKFLLKRLVMDSGTDVDAAQLGFNTQLYCTPCTTATTQDFKNYQGTYLSFARANVTGDIAYLSNFIKNYMVDSSSVVTSGIYGSIDCLVGLTKMLPTALLSAKTNAITGNIVAVLATAADTKISSTWYYVTGFSGDLSLLKEDFYYMNNASHFTWKNTRPSSYPIIMFNNVELDDDVDAMLINQANCTLADSSKYMDGGSVKNQISVKGTHTPGTAVNAAIKALIALGITVKVNNVTLTGDET